MGYPKIGMLKWTGQQSFAMNKSNFNLNDWVANKIKNLFSKPKLPLTFTIHTDCKKDITLEEIIDLAQEMEKYRE